MAERPTQQFRDEHAELIGHVEHIRKLAAEIARLDPEQRTQALAPVVQFLRGTLVPHAEAEEQILYPEWARLIGHEEAAVPMVHDHEAIVTRIDQLAQTAPDDTDTLQELLYGLYALISVHFRKEEDIQLPVFDAQPPEVAAAVFERMGHQAGHEH